MRNGLEQTCVQEVARSGWAASGSGQANTHMVRSVRSKPHCQMRGMSIYAAPPHKAMVAVTLPHPAANASPSVPDAEPTAPTRVAGAPRLMLLC